MGHLIAEASDEKIPRPVVGGEMDLHEGIWDEVRIYEDDKGRYIIGIAHKTNWNGKSDVKSVHECKTIKRVLDRVRLHAPYCAGIIEEQLCQSAAG